MTSAFCEDLQARSLVCSVDLYIECTQLRDSDVLSKSDPCAVLFMSGKGPNMTEIGRTETLRNTLNPKFARPIRVDYHFEDVQMVDIVVYDVDNPSRILTNDDAVGSVKCTLGQILTSQPFKRALTGIDKKNHGEITIRAYRATDDGDKVELRFSAKHLDDMDVLSKSDPFLEIQKQTSDGNWQLVHRTEAVMNNNDPTWRPFTMSTNSLCDEDKEKPIKIICYDYENSGIHDLIGMFTTSLEELLSPTRAKIGFDCINPKKAQKKRGYRNSGVIYVNCLIALSAKDKIFLDYVFGGITMNFIVGIDFTQSNGDPSSSESLHHISPITKNEYMMAIRAVGDICQYYDSDRLFPAFGFGAKIPPSNNVSHDFPINFNSQNPNCAGIDGVLEAYKLCLQKIELLGPTIVAPIIKRAIQLSIAAQSQESVKGAHAYNVLLLLTDGIFNDMGETKKAIVEASCLPLSVIIIGVGQSDFSEMKELSESGEQLKTVQGAHPKRDIVQFVSFRDFKLDSMEKLASCVLAKIPSQVTDYFKMRGLEPNPPKIPSPVQPTTAL